MRRRYLVTYDIRHPKRLRVVYRKMKGFGDALQYSVFRCDLTEAEKIRLKASLGETINHAEDRILIVDLGPVSGRAGEAFEVLGSQEQPPEKRDAYIV